MQFIFELLAALVVWAASIAFAQFGIEVDMSRTTAGELRVIERTVPVRAEQSVNACPDEAKAKLRRV